MFMQSSDQHSIRSLYLDSCRFLLSSNDDTLIAAADIANLLCGNGSSFHHITMDLGGIMPSEQVGDFFECLTRLAATRDAAPPSPLRSLQLDITTFDTMQHLARYLPVVVHLTHLTVVCQTRPNLFARPFRLILERPCSFLASLRRNGSLHHVEFRDAQEREYPSADVMCIISAITTRNRVLPQLLLTAFGVKKAPLSPLAVTSSSPSLLPTMCVATMQAPRLAPTLIFRGFLASSESLTNSECYSSVI
jgi:hypothetical protein